LSELRARTIIKHIDYTVFTVFIVAFNDLNSRNQRARCVASAAVLMRTQLLTASAETEADACWTDVRVTAERRR